MLAAATAQDKCPNGCATCQPMTATEIAARKAKKDAQRSSWLAKIAQARGKDTNNDGTIDAADVATRSERMQKREKPANWVPQTCLTCNDAKAYQLVDGRCVCATGYGHPLPKPDANGKFVKPSTPPACSECKDNTVSGPDAPPVDWAALGFKKDARRSAFGAAPATGGRHLLGGGGGHHKSSFCVPCPAGTNAQGGAKCV